MLLTKPVTSTVNTLYGKDEVECLALNVYHESRNTSTAGRLAVLFVTRNRLDSSLFPSDSYCSVVYQGKHNERGVPLRDRCHFSWYCDGRSDYPANRLAWDNAVSLSEWFLFTNHYLPDITDGSTHYHASWMEKYPGWSFQKRKMALIDEHIFYK